MWLLGLPCARALQLPSLFLVDTPGFHGARPNVPDSPKVLHCAVRLKRSRSSGPLFRRAAVLQNEDFRPFITHSCTARFAAASAVGVARVCEGGLLPFVCKGGLICLLSCFLLVAGPCTVQWRVGKAPVLCGCVCLLYQALGAVARRRGLEVRDPVLQPQVGGLGAGFVVKGRAQKRRGCWWISWRGSRAGLARPCPLMTRERAAGSCAVFARSWAAERRCCCQLPWRACFINLKGERTGDRCFAS